MKATAKAPANVGLIKYWGRKDEDLRLPENGSISVNLSGLQTTTTVEYRKDLPKDEITINGTLQQDEESRVIKHLDRIRKLGKITKKAKVVTVNSFPTSTGLSSSSSGFAALTLAGTKAAGLELSEKELSILARFGSGSACRSIPDGFVEWLPGDTSDTSYAISIFPPDYWDIVDLVAVVSTSPKDISSSQGQKNVFSSPFYKTRLLNINKKLELMRNIIKEKNFPAFGELIEAEAFELHAIMLTTIPSLIYWTPGTLKIMKMVKKWRVDGLPVYFTINTGQDIHLFCEKKDEEKVETILRKIPDVKEIINNYPSVGAKIIDNHLF